MQKPQVCSRIPTSSSLKWTASIRRRSNCKSPIDIEWNLPPHDQLEPQLYGELKSKKLFDDLRAIRKKVPKISDDLWKAFFPSKEHSKIIVLQPVTFARHYVNLQAVATWVLNGIQSFTVLEQPMMIAIWTKDWQDAAKFQYLMQILQVKFDDYIPKWHIFVERQEEVQKLVLQWQSPTAIWSGHAVIGFMAETDFDGRSAVGFAEFNPMWSFPTHSVSSNYDNITFGMEAPHIKKDPPNPKDALISQSPIVVFKAATVLQSLGIIASRILLPSSDVAGEEFKGSNTLSNDMELCL